MKKGWFCLVLWVSGVAAAGPYERCLETAGGATQPVLACMAQALKREDVRLNAAYRRMMAALPEPRRRALREVQRAWIRYRDLKCRFLYHPTSGSGGLQDQQQCLIDETRRRAGELEAGRP